MHALDAQLSASPERLAFFSEPSGSLDDSATAAPLEALRERDTHCAAQGALANSAHPACHRVLVGRLSSSSRSSPHSIESPRWTAHDSVRNMHDPLAPQEIARRHASNRRANGGGAAGTVAANATARAEAEAERDAAVAHARALETNLAAVEARAVAAEEAAAGAQAADTALRALETKLAAAKARATTKPAPAMTDYSPPRATDVVSHGDDEVRPAKVEIEGCDGGLWDYTDDNFELDDEEEEAVRQDLCMAPWNSYVVSPSPRVSDDASATGHTYDDITKSPPPHLRCVILPLFYLPPVLRGTAASLPRFWFRPCSSPGCHSVIWCSSV